MKWSAIFAVLVVATCALASAGDVQASAGGQVPHAVVKKVRIGTTTWELVVVDRPELPASTGPCFFVGTSLYRHTGFGGPGESCELPFWGGSVVDIGPQPKAVTFYVFPRNVVRLKLKWREMAEQTVPLRLLPVGKARQAHVKPFRWAYRKEIGEQGCLEEITGYGARGGLVYRAAESAGTTCSPQTVHGRS